MNSVTDQQFPHMGCLGHFGRLGFVLVVLALWLIMMPVWAESRLALVIGNGGYLQSPLKNPVNDAQDIAAKLRDLGFQTIERVDADRQTMRLALREFEQRLRQQRGVGLFYYAGHGVQLKGQNYLIPVGADIRQEFEVPDEAIDAEAVLRAMESAGNELNIVILDACRNNPFIRGYGTAGRGLARMEGPAGTFIAYATSPGAISQDGGEGRNSPYTRSLLAAMSAPGLNLEQVFKQVLVAVERETSGAQIPWVASSLRGDFFFNNPAAPAVVPAPTGMPAPAAPVSSHLPSPTAASNPPDSPSPAPVPDPAAAEPALVAVANADFLISRQPISVAAFARFANNTELVAASPAAADDNQGAAAHVTWPEAIAYAAWLSLKSGQHYRLPTEAEWEQAARSNPEVLKPGGEDREWTCSEYQQIYQGQERRCAAHTPEIVAIRGHAWRSGADPLSDDVGFRLVRQP